MSTGEAEWEAQLALLAAYKAAHGDCKVPRLWAEDPKLATWVHKQRTLKKKLDRGEPSEGMTAERAERLTALGLVWDPGEAEWEAQLARLAAYKAEYGDCYVPQAWAEDPRMGSWVNSQRQFKRKLDRGEPGVGMTAERVAKLDEIGFVWDPGTDRKNKNNKGIKPTKKITKAKKHAKVSDTTPMGIPIAMATSLDDDNNKSPLEGVHDDMDLGLNLDDDDDDDDDYYMPSLKNIPLPKSFGGSVDKKRKSKRKKRKSKIKSKRKSK